MIKDKLIAFIILGFGRRTGKANMAIIACTRYFNYELLWLTFKHSTRCAINTEVASLPGICVPVIFTERLHKYTIYS